MNDDRAVPTTAVAVADADNAHDPRRRELLARLGEDREELLRAAGAVRRRLAMAQDSLALARQGLRWLLVLGGLAAAVISIRRHRRPPALLLAGLSLYLAPRWRSSGRAPGRQARAV